MKFKVGTLVVAKQDYILNGPQIFTKGDTYFVEEHDIDGKYIRDDIDIKRRCIAPFCHLVFSKSLDDKFTEAMTII